MKRCPHCDNDLQVIDIDVEGYDILGCEECSWNEITEDNLIKDMEFYI